MEMVSTLAFAFLAGAMTLLGGIILRTAGAGRRTMQFSLTATTGIVVSVLLLGMLDASVSLHSSLLASFAFLGGGLLMLLCGYAFPHTYTAEKYEDRLYSLLKTGTLVMTGIILYNIPAGLAVAAASSFSFWLGAVVFIAVSLQNISRGFAIDDPLTHMGMESRKRLIVMLLSAVPALVGGLIGYFMLSSSPQIMLSGLMAFSAGAYGFVCIDQLIPLIKGYSRRRETAAALFTGLFVGILLLGLV